MKAKDEIKELFSDTLGNFEADVNPNLWGGIQSQIGVGAAAKSTGIGLIGKASIVLAVVGTTVVSAVLLSSAEEPKESKEEVVAKTEAKPKVEEISGQNTVLDFVGEESEGSLPVELPIPKEKAKDGETPTLNDGPDEFSLPLIPKESLIAEDNLGDKTIKKDKPKKYVSDDNNGEKAIDEDFRDENETFVLKSNVNIFSPNGDNRNDEFFITASGELFNFSIVIMSSTTGEVVYRSKNPSFIWDGTNPRNEIVRSGSYLYIITAKDKEGKSILQNQSLEVISN